MAKKRESILIVLMISIIIVYSIMPIVARFFSAYLTTYSYMLILLLAIALVFVSRGQYSVGEYLVLLAPFIVWEVFNYYTTKPSIILWGYTALLHFTPFILGVYIVKRADKGNAKPYAFLAILAIIVTAITTIIGLEEYPDAARVLATSESGDDPLAVKYSWANIGGYEFVYTVVLLYPLVIFAYKQKKIGLIFVILFGALDLSLLVSAGYTIALLLWIISTVFIFFDKNLKVKQVIITGLIFALFFILFSELLSSGLKWLADVVDNDTIADRLRDLSDGKQGLENSEDNRLELYMISLNSFLTRPLFGGMFSRYSIGGHSFVLDSLSRYGLFGGFMLVLMYSNIYKKFYKPYKQVSGYGYIFWLFLQSIVLSTINTGMWLYVLCLYAPVLISYIEQKGERHEIILGRKYAAK